MGRLDADFADRLEQEKLSALAEFAAGAGHEINNPLAVISGRAQLFLRHERDPERRRDLALINSQARRVHEMIADLMLFARPPAPRLADCDVRQVVEKVVEELSGRAAEAGIKISVHFDEDLPSIQADATQLQVAVRPFARMHSKCLDQVVRLRSPVGGTTFENPLPSRERERERSGNSSSSPSATTGRACHRTCAATRSTRFIPAVAPDADSATGCQSVGALSRCTVAGWK